MDNWVLWGLIGIGAYFAMKFFSTKKIETNVTEDVLNNPNYRIKGQWDKE